MKSSKQVREKELLEFVKLTETVREWFKNEEIEVMDTVHGRFAIGIKHLLDSVREEKDYIVVKDINTAIGLVSKKAPKSLRGKYVIVAPDGIEFVSKEDLLKLPAVKEIREEYKGMIESLRDDRMDDGSEGYYQAVETNQKIDQLLKKLA